MNKNKVLSLEGTFYQMQGKKLFECTYGIKEVSPEKYAYIDNYGLKPHNAIIIGSHFFWIKNDCFVEVASNLIVSNGTMFFFRTNPTGDNGSEIYVHSFYSNGNVALLGRSFEEIMDGLYKIGNRIYQLKKGSLDYLQTCQEWEMWRGKLEIHTGEPGASDFFVYEKSGEEWKQKYHTNSTVYNP